MSFPRFPVRYRWPLAAGAALLAALYGCGGGSSSSAASGSAAGSAATTTTTTTTTTSNTSATVDPTHLPVGDNLTTTAGPKAGYLYLCRVQSGGGGASSKGPWFNSDGTWNSSAKVAAQGAVQWVSQFAASLAGGALNISGNGLPSHATGVFPIQASDPAHAYDPNPNSIAPQTIAWGLPGNPQVNASPACVGGVVGVLLTGARLFNAVDGENRDALAWEIQDSCQGHPENTGAYHYHSVSTCVQKDTPGQHSPLVGYAADGFGIYGNLGENGKALTNADLDECHGHTHAVTINGASVVQYHYHATREFPYTLGCFRGTPATVH